MMEHTLTRYQPARRRVTLRFLGGVLLTLALAVAFFYWLMRPSMDDLQAMARFLSITAGISALAGYAAYRLGLIQRAPSLRVALFGSYALASVLTFFNVWLTARLMFASAHDLQLAVVLLFFAGGIAMSLGYFLAAALVDGMSELAAGARAIAAGRLETRVPVPGRNEMGELATSFNDMAVQLQTAEKKQRELETMRRNLVAWAGHDLRTPLASVQVLVEALADGVVDDPATVQRYLGAIQRNTQALSSLVDDLFDLAQLDAGAFAIDRQPTAVADVISDTIERYSDLAIHQGVTLSGDIMPGLPTIPIDSPKIERVLANLVGNALRHTPTGGSITIRATSTPQAVRIDVIDSGEGINPEDLPYIFDQFYRGEKSRSRATGGAGLGLAIARRIVAAHGGEIEVESNMGQGARFSLILPLS